MGVGWASGADQTRLSPYEFEVGLVAEPTGLAEGQHALVDLAGNGVSLEMEYVTVDDQSFGAAPNPKLGSFWQKNLPGRIGFVLAKPTCTRHPASEFSAPSLVGHHRPQSPFDARRRLVRQ